MNVVLTLTVDVGEPADKQLARQILHDNLNRLVQLAMDESLITGDSDLTVEDYVQSIKVTE